MSLAAPREQERYLAIDVARGFALLGIFLANIAFFSLPLGAALEQKYPAESTLDQAAWWLVHGFCLGKFYPLFSMLFGIGFVLQKRSLEGHDPGRYVRIYLRRTLLLMAIGLVHGLLIWYGDILFIYSFCALLLLACSRLGARWLLAIAGALLVASVLLTAGLGALGVAFAGSAGAEPAAVEVAISSPEAAEPHPFLEWTRHFSAIQEGPTDPFWIELETRAYRDGGLLDIAGFGAVSFAGMLLFMLAGGGWHILAMFFLGAALCRLGLLEAPARPQRRRLLALALLVGLPLAIFAAALLVVIPGDIGPVASATVNLFAGPLVAIGYLLAWFEIVDGKLLQRLTRWLAATGRMALSNYLAQSVVAAALMRFWGLGLFGSLSPLERVALVLLLFPLQVAISVWWMSRYRFGPLEWLWRSATYARRQPWRRGIAGEETA